MQILGRARKSPRFSENFGNAASLFLRSLKVFCRCFYDFLKFTENLRKSSEMYYLIPCLNLPKTYARQLRYGQSVSLRLNINDSRKCDDKYA